MKIFNCSLFVFVLMSCASKRNSHNFDAATYSVVKIEENFYCDRTEISNFHWLEYLYWIQQIFGQDSKQYLSALPDSNSLRTAKCPFPYPDDHFRMVEYKDFPVVAISQDQALKFSQWRSDRVFEHYLIERKNIQLNPNQTAENYFSIETYFAGNYYDVQDSNGVIQGDPIVPNKNLHYPVYMLPSQLDRLKILDYVDSTDYIFHQKRSKEYERWREENLPFQLAISTCPKTLGNRRSDSPLRSTLSKLDTKHEFNLLYDIRGNVAEWGDSTSITYGGGWPHNVEYVLSKDTISSYSTNAWTGFRNVCRWKKWED